MISFLRFVLYLFIMNSYFMLMNKKFNVDKVLCIPLVFLIQILILYFGGILNLLQLFVFLSVIGSLGSYIYLLYKKILTKKYFCEYFDYKILLFYGLLIFLFFWVSSFKLIHYDNFSHWALVVKNLLHNHSLGSFEYSLDQFASYPRGSALFIYYFCLFVGNTEGVMILGNLILNMGVMSSILILLPNNKNKLLSGSIYVLVVIIFMIINNSVDSLLVDNLVGLLGMMSFIVCYYYKRSINTCFKFLSIISIVQILIKNGSLYLILVNFILIIILGIYNKSIKSSIKYCFYMLLMIGGVFIIWRAYLLQVYPGDYGINTKHSLSYKNIITNFSNKGLIKIKEILNVYIPQLYNYKNICFQYMLILNFIFLGTFYAITKSLKKTVIGILSVDLIYLFYFLALGLVYIFSMPYNEAIVLAGYDRYMLTIIISLVGILLIGLFYIIKNNLKLSFVSMLFCCLFFCFIIYNNGKNVLFNHQNNYESSAAYDAYNISKKINLDNYKNYTKMFVIDTTRASWDFYYYALKYYYFEDDILVFNEYYNINNLAEGTIVIIPDEKNKILDNKFLKPLEDYIYIVEKSVT